MSPSKVERVDRRYIRHPSGVPIHVDLHSGRKWRRHRLRNVSDGGLCFASRVELEPGRTLRVAIPVRDQSFHAEAVVAWCRPEGEGFEVGVRFRSPQDRFGMRMAEQLCHIEAYRRDVHAKEGRDLSPEQAAEEWIARFAARFPDLH